MKAVTRVLLVAIALGVAGGRAAAKTTTWTGLAGDGKWATPGNWDNGNPTNSIPDTLIFDSGSATGATINIPTGSGAAGRPVYYYFRFTNNCASYCIGVTNDYIDESNIGAANALQTSLGMTNNQTLGRWRIGQPYITLDGPGDVTYTNGIENANGWTMNQRNQCWFYVNHADAVLTVCGIELGKRTDLYKSGAGRLVLTKTVDWTYGTNTFTAGTTNIAGCSIAVSGGSVDVSAATLKLERYNNADLTPGKTFLVLSYTNATLVNNASFAIVSNVPAGWEVVNLPQSFRIVIREVSSRPKGSVIQLK